MCVCVCVCVCEREREKERENLCLNVTVWMLMCVYGFVCLSVCRLSINRVNVREFVYRPVCEYVCVFVYLLEEAGSSGHVARSPCIRLVQRVPFIL